jgi:predicted DNA-binding transcriptional regulator AlpA
MGRAKSRKQLRTASNIVAPKPDPELDFDRVVSEAQAAQLLGLSRDTLRRHFRAGRAPARVRLSEGRIGYRLSAIYAFLEAHTEQPGTRP